MDFDEFMRQVLAVFPEATVDEDSDGQLVVSTGLQEIENGQVVTFAGAPNTPNKMVDIVPNPAEDGVQIHIDADETVSGVYVDGEQVWC